MRYFLEKALKIAASPKPLLAAGDWSLYPQAPSLLPPSITVTTLSTRVSSATRLLLSKKKKSNNSTNVLVLILPRFRGYILFQTLQTLLLERKNIFAPGAGYNSYAADYKSLCQADDAQTKYKNGSM